MIMDDYHSEEEEEEEEDSEHSYVYCTYPPTKMEADEKDIVIAELKQKIAVLKRERDEYKRKATLYGNIIASRRGKKFIKKRMEDEPEECTRLPNHRGRWVSMTNKMDWFS